jgi:uncharacterized membrane protein
MPVALPKIHILPASRPFTWLAQGWRDLWHCGLPSLLQGVLLSLFGQALLALAHDRFWLLVGAFSGLLVGAPILAVGFYALSQALEKQFQPSFRTVLRTWLSWRHHGDGKRGKDWRLVRFGLLLALAGTGWMLTSAALITLHTPEPVLRPVDFLRYVVLSRKHYVFELWLTMGGLMFAPIFASCFIAVPLMMERRVRILHAVVISWDAVLQNPGVAALWAALILLLMLVGLSTALLGLMVIVPWLGHASWHAYRDLIDASAWPERTAPLSGKS